MWELDCEESWAPKNWTFWTVVLEKTLESPLDCKKIQPNLATSCEELTHWKRLWCWEGLGAGGKGDDREWDSWMASPTQWTWVWVNSRRWWWTGRPGVLRFMGSQIVGHDWATELNWIELPLFMVLTLLKMLCLLFTTPPSLPIFLRFISSLSISTKSFQTVPKITKLYAVLRLLIPHNLLFILYTGMLVAVQCELVSFSQLDHKLET